MWHKAYDGISTDPKWVCIAAMAGVLRKDVVAVWTYLLDQASQAEIRGTIGHADLRVAAAWLEMPVETVAAILAAMITLGMVVDGRIAKWERRQRDLSTPRVQAFRERQRAQGYGGVRAEPPEHSPIPAAPPPAQADIVAPTPAFSLPIPAETLVKRDETQEIEKKIQIPDLGEDSNPTRAARAPASPRDKERRHMFWLHQTLMVEARNRLTPEKWEKLCVASMEDPMPAWARKELNRISDEAQAAKRARGEGRPGRGGEHRIGKLHFALPIAGGMGTAPGIAAAGRQEAAA